jgi:general secretion pathway protein G
MKKAFSLLEIIFVITIVALVSSFMLKSGFGFLEKANITQTKTQIALIRNSLNTLKNKRILKGLSEFPAVLDNAKINTHNELLFTGTPEEKLLDFPLIATTTEQKEVGSFIKTASNTYEVYVDKQNVVKFTYNSSEGTFSCDYANEFCKELD